MSGPVGVLKPQCLESKETPLGRWFLQKSQASVPGLRGQESNRFRGVDRLLCDRFSGLIH